jgi:transposase
MVLNSIGFMEQCLYLYPEFFENIAINRLIGDGVATNQHSILLLLQTVSGNGSNKRHC